MSVEVLRRVWDYSESRNSERLVLLAIADCCNRSDGSGAWPSIAELVRKTRLSERGVQAAIKRLVLLGELKVELNGGRNGTNRYHVIVSGTPAESAPPQDLHPAESAGVPQNTSSQVNPNDPAESAPPANSAPPQISADTPAESAPGTTKNHQYLKPSSETSSPTSAKESTTGKTAEDEPVREDVEALCTRLAEWVVKNGNKAPTIGKRWRDAARLLIDVDERELSKALALIEWSQRNEFWRRNIQSMSKFREKYDALRLQANDEWAKNARGGHRFELPESNAPRLLPASEKCEEHRRPKATCGYCKSDEKGTAA